MKPEKTALYKKYKNLVEYAKLAEDMKKAEEKAKLDKAQEDLNTLLGKKKKKSPSSQSKVSGRSNKRGRREYNPS